MPLTHTDDTKERATCTAFAGTRRLASGSLEQVALAVKAALDGGELSPILVFDDSTSAVIDLDLHGTPAEVRERVAAMTAGPAVPDAVAAPAGAATPRGPGRPRLGVVAREVTLLPRHWEWLNEQPGGASAALRRLVDQARRNNAGKDRVRRAQEAAYRFMSAMAGDAPGFEEAIRALFAGNEAVFDALVEPWPADVRDYARKLAVGAFVDVAADGGVAGSR